METHKIVGWSLVGLFCLYNLCYSAYKHGQPRDTEHNFWISLISTIINLGLFALVAF